jgi:hypothetical protein
VVRRIARIDNGPVTTCARGDRSGGGKESDEMDPTDHASPRGIRRLLTRTTAAMVVLVLVGGAVLGGCSASDQGGTAAAAATMAPATMAPATPMATPAAAGGAMAATVPTDAAAAWASRPDFVKADASTEAAYSFALNHPGVIEWMPCYCGCVKLDHRSNLDCYLKPPTAGKATEFEQHASFCGICVQTTLLAQQMSEQGKSLHEIRQAVDQQFGGSVPGTNTAQPPG